MWLPLTVASTALLTGGLYRYAIAYGVLDFPNERSAHTTPTPRGGGVAIVVMFLALVGLLWSAGVTTPSVAIALIGSGTTVALVGFFDDHRPIAAQWRLLVHLLAASWALWWLGGLPILVIGAARVDLGWWGHVTAVIGLVWLLNLYNFMDGIDGIAGSEAFTVGCAAAFLYWQGGLGQGELLLPALLAMAALGFLFWNWPPAKIFMGDAGSGFLGLMLGVLVVRSAWLRPELFWAWLILLGVFIVDATATLVRRFGRDQRVHHGHNDHAYHHAARVLGHRAVTVAVGGMNLFWLLPVAVLVNAGWCSGPAGIVLAYAPLLVSAIYYNAGLEAPDSLAV